MAKYKRRGRSRSGGFKSLLMPLAIGGVAGAFSDKIPVINSMPPVVAGTVGGYIAKKSLMGALAGAAGSVFLSSYIKGMVGNTTSTSSAW